MGRLRRNAKRWAILASVLVLLGCVALFVRAYRNAAPPDTQAHSGSSLTPGAPTLTPSSSPHASTASPASRKSKSAAIEPTDLAPYLLSVPEAPGFKLVGPKAHHLVMSATSAARIPEVGYLVPTSRDHSYGTARPRSTNWSLSTDVTGGPDWAVVFVQAGASGAPITCTITVDGKVRDSRTTSGPYGRQVCVG